MSLDERYGRRTARARRPLLLVVLGVFVVAALAWAVWAASGLARSTLTWRDLGADAADPALVRVSFEVTPPAGQDAVCAVRATAADGAIVGWADVVVPRSQAPTTRATATVRTSRPATGGGVASCGRR